MSPRTWIRMLWASLAFSLTAPSAWAQTPDDAEHNWRLGVEAGVMSISDGGVGAASKEGSMGGGEFGVNRRLWGPVWVGARYTIMSAIGQVFGSIDAHLMTHGPGAHLMVRPELGPSWLRPYVRGAGQTLAIEVNWGDLADPILTARGRTWGVTGGLGLDSALIAPEVFGGDCTLGLNVELRAQRFAPVNLSAAGTDLGTLDLSGWGMTFGVIATF